MVMNILFHRFSTCYQQLLTYVSAPSLSVAPARSLSGCSDILEEPLTSAPETSQPAACSDQEHRITPEEARVVSSDRNCHIPDIVFRMFLTSSL